MDSQLPEYPGTPPDAATISDHDGPGTPAPVEVVCRTLDGGSHAVECDHIHSVGWLRMTVGKWLQVPTVRVTLIRHDRVLQKETTKIVDVMDGWESSPAGRTINVLIESGPVWT